MFYGMQRKMTLARLLLICLLLLFHKYYCYQSIIIRTAFGFPKIDDVWKKTTVLLLGLTPYLLLTAPLDVKADNIGCSNIHIARSSSIQSKTGQERSSSDELVRGLLGGAASRVTKEVILHPLDTIKSRIQGKANLPPSNQTNTALFRNLYDGLIPSLIGGIPAGSVFFGIKDFTKSYLKSQFLDLSKAEVTILSVVIANLPYWIIRTPSEVIKTRDQLFSSQILRTSTLDTIKDFPLLYRSFFSNLIYALPADIIKFLAYEQITSSYFGMTSKVEGFEAAMAGALASSVAQLLTTPLDVIRVRTMSRVDKGSDQSSLEVIQNIMKEEGVQALFLGTYLRLARAVVSGAVQFASYELTRNYFS